LGEDGQTSDIIAHAGQLPCTLPESLNVSLPTFKCSFYLPIHALGKVTNNYCCCCLVAGPLPTCWVRPYHAAAAFQLIPHPSTG